MHTWRFANFASPLPTCAAAMASLVQLELDEKDKENFQEMQASIQKMQQEIHMLSTKLRSRNAEAKHSQLTLAELADLPEGTRTYDQVGKMFLLQPLPEVKSKLTENVAASEKETVAMTETRTKREEEFKKLQEDFQEFVKAHVVEAKEEEKDKKKE